MDGPDPSAGPALQGAGGDDDHDPGDKTSEAGGELDNDPAPGRFPFTVRNPRTAPVATVMLWRTAQPTEAPNSPSRVTALPLEHHAAVPEHRP